MKFKSISMLAWCSIFLLSADLSHSRENVFQKNAEKSELKVEKIDLKLTEAEIRQPVELEVHVRKKEGDAELGANLLFVSIFDGNDTYEINSNWNEIGNGVYRLLVEERDYAKANALQVKVLPNNTCASGVTLHDFKLAGQIPLVEIETQQDGVKGEYCKNTGYHRIWGCPDYNGKSNANLTENDQWEGKSAEDFVKSGLGRNQAFVDGMCTGTCPKSWRGNEQACKLTGLLSSNGDSLELKPTNGGYTGTCTSWFIHFIDIKGDCNCVEEKKEASDAR